MNWDFWNCGREGEDGRGCTGSLIVGWRTDLGYKKMVEVTGWRRWWAAGELVSARVAGKDPRSQQSKPLK